MSSTSASGSSSPQSASRFKSILRGLLFFFILLAITGGAHVFIFSRVARPLAGEQNVLWLAWVMGILWLNLFLGFGLLRILPDALRRWYESVLFLWMGMALFLLMASVPVFLLATLVSFEVKPEHRAMATVGLACFLGGIGFLKAQRSRVVVTSLPLLGRPRGTLADGGQTINGDPGGIRIAVLSDIHVSGTLGARRLRRIAARVKALKPDLIFILGDLVDGSVRQLGRDVLALRDLDAAGAQAIYFVTGNHEYFSGASSWKSFIKGNLCWDVLENDRRHIECKGYRLVIAGIDDRQSLWGDNVFGPRQQDRRLAAALEGLSAIEAKEQLVMLLAHQPKDAHQLAAEPRVHLQVSGHTHGGQIWPFGMVARRDQGFLSGHYELGGNQHLYVSEGTCYWGLPFRLGTQCEISLLHLTT